MKIALILIMLLLLNIPAFSQEASAGSKNQQSAEDARENAKKEQKEFERQQKEKYKYFAIITEPEGATIEIAGKAVGTTPYRQEVKENYIYNGLRFAFSSLASR